MKRRTRFGRFLSIPVAVVIGGFIGTLLGVQLVVRITALTTVVVCELSLVHVITKRRLWTIVGIVWTISYNTTHTLTLTLSGPGTFLCFPPLAIFSR